MPIFEEVISINNKINIINGKHLYYFVFFSEILIPLLSIILTNFTSKKYSSHVNFYRVNYIFLDLENHTQYSFLIILFMIIN